MHILRGIRARLSATLVALVALTAILLGTGAYVFVENGLRDQVLRDAHDQAAFDLAVIVPAADLPPDPTRDDIGDSRLLDTFHARGVGAIVDLAANGVAVSSSELEGVVDALPADLRDRVASGQLAYAWMTVAGAPSLVVGGRVGGTGPAFYFVHDTTELESALAQFRVALVAGALILIFLALLAARWIARGVLAPVEAASRAGELLIADVGRLRTLVDELMELSRFDARAERIAVEPVDLGRLVRSVAAARLPEATVHAPADRLIIDTDPRRLDRILGNLLDNAREHAPRSPVEVTLSTMADGVVIAGPGRGPGVAPDQLGHLFDRFYKADPSRHGGSSGSSGLGLAIAAEHAALLGGTLTAMDRPGGGLQVQLRLPVTEPLRVGDEIATDSSDAGIPTS